MTVPFIQPTAVFIVGAPGVGKTSLARLLLGMPGTPISLVPKPKWTLGEGICAAGHYLMQAFDGADTVPYNGAREALDYWVQELVDGYPLTLFDGDRFSNTAALVLVSRHARTRVVWLGASEEVLNERRRQRGSSQNPSWMKGRATKAVGFADGFLRVDRLDLDASTSGSAELFERVRAWL